MKILHVMAGLQFSGMEKMLLSSAEEWGRRNIHCEILSTASEVGPLRNPLIAAGYPVHPIPFRSQKPFLPNFQFLIRSWQLYREGSFDVVHIHTEEAMVLFVLLARLASVQRVVLTVHNTFRFAGYQRLRKIVERILVRAMGARFGFVSDAVAANEQRRFYNRGVRIANWIDTAQFRPPLSLERDLARQSLGLAPSTTVIVTIGNCNAAKNHGTLLHALSMLSEPQDLLYFHIGLEKAGGPEQQLAAALGLSHRVRFVGRQPDVLPWLWAADIFAMPSRYEGLAIAPLEAIASGCPVLLADVDGLAELAVYAPNIVFASPSPERFAKALRHLTRKPGAARRELAWLDSASIRAQFTPEIGIDTLCRALYPFEL